MKLSVVASVLALAGSSFAAPKPNCNWYHTVQSGQTSLMIARDVCLLDDFDDFKSYNTHVPNLSAIYPGQIVCCSAPKTEKKCKKHKIKSGDLCYNLATKYGVAVKDIEFWNEESNPGWDGCNYLRPGQKICVSSGVF